MPQQNIQQGNKKEVNTQPPSKENNWNQSLNKRKSEQKQKQQQKQKQISVMNIFRENNNNKMMGLRSQQEYQYQEQQMQQQGYQQQKQQEQIVDENNNQQQFKQQLRPVNRLTQQNKPITNKNNNSLKHQTSTSPLHNKLSHQQLQSIFEENQQQIKQFKQLISQHRQQLKKIGQQVDEDLQKSMITQNTNNNSNNKFISATVTTVNIKQLFNQKINLNEPQKIKTLRQQLLMIRKQCKVLKQQILIKSQQINDPVNRQNYYKQQQLLSRLKMMNLQVGNKRKEAGLVKQEVKRLKVAANVDEVEEMEIKITEGEEVMGKVVVEIKEEKARAYKLQKEDIWLMEKYKFLIQRKTQLDNNNNTNTITTANQKKLTNQHLSQQVTSFISQINTILEQRNKTQTQRSRLLKQLNAQVQEYEGRNLLTVSELRSIDAYLLQYYSQQKHGGVGVGVGGSGVSGSVNNNSQSGSVNNSRIGGHIDNNNTNNNNSSTFMTKSNASKQSKSFSQQKKQSLLESPSILVGQNRSKQLYGMIVNDKNVISSMGNNNNSNKTATGSKFRTKVTSNNSNNSNSNNKPHTQKTQSIVNTQSQQHQHQQQQHHQQHPQHPQKFSFTFGDMKTDQKGAILSDQILGEIKIKQLTLLVDDQNCYGLYCKYVELQQGKEVNGMKIHEKNVQGLQVGKIKLAIKDIDDVFISSIKVGYANGVRGGDIKLVEILTTSTIATNSKGMTIGNKQQSIDNSSLPSLKWKAKSYQQPQSNNTNNNKFIDELAITQPYITLSIKAKLISTQQVHAISKSLNQLGKIKPKLKLAGFAINYTLGGGNKKM